MLSESTSLRLRLTGPEEKSLWIVTAQGVQDHEIRRHTIAIQGEETTSDKTTRNRARMRKKVWLYK